MLDDREKARLLLDLQGERRITWAHFDRMDERRAFLEWLRAQAPQPVIPLSFSGEGDPWERIVQATRGAGTVVLSGDELLWGEARDAWRRALNLGRDRISDLEAPVVILADAALLDEVAQRAPDLWSWRGSVVEGDYEPWRVEGGKEPVREGLSKDPLRADVGARPDLYVEPPAGSAFAVLADTIPALLLGGSEGCSVLGVAGAGRRTLAEVIRRRLEGQALVVHYGDNYREEIAILELLGRVSIAPEMESFAQEEMAALGRELRTLLGVQLTDMALKVARGNSSYPQGDRLEARLRSGPAGDAIRAAFHRCARHAAGLGLPVVVFRFADIYHTPPRCLKPFGISVCNFRNSDWPSPVLPPLDAHAASGHCAAILAARAPWLPAALRHRVVSWADGVPGLALSITRECRDGMTHGALTRVAVAAAATRVAANFSVGPGHERLLSTVGTRDERPKRFKFWSEAFLRYPPDGAPPYVHPLWLLALGRDVDPEGPPHRFPPGSGVPDKPDFLPSAH